MNIRERLTSFASDYWWLLLIVVGVGYFFTDISIFKYLAYVVAIPFALMIFLPFLIQLFSPAYFLATSLIEHFNKSEGMYFSKKWFFIPSALVSAVSFVVAQMILTLWVGITSFLIWVSIIGFFWTFLGFFFGLAPLGVLAAPFIVWYYEGFATFLALSIFFLLTLFWFALSKLAFPENYSSTPEDFLGYSPQTFLLGALSFQVIALTFYQFNLFFVGSILADFVAPVFLILALVSALKWRSLKKKLTPEELQYLYKPSAWVYILGFLFTNLLYIAFQKYEAPTAVLFWLNGFFLVGLINRFIGLFRRKEKVAEVQYEIEQQ